MIESLPAFPLLLGAVLVAVTRGPLRALVMLAAPLLGAWGVYQLEPGTVVELQMMGLQLTPVRVDALSILFGYLFHIAAFLGIVFALHLRDTLQHAAALAYAGAHLDRGGEAAVGAVAGELHREVDLVGAALDRAQRALDAVQRETATSKAMAEELLQDPTIPPEARLLATWASAPSSSALASS